jgi:hypothetical protein
MTIDIREQRQAVVREALTWLRTPFMYDQCVKGVGVDCGRFLAAVFNNAGVKRIDIAKLPHIPPGWFLHKQKDAPSPYLSAILTYSVEYNLAPGQIPEVGDIVLAKEARDWAHGAIVVAWPKVIGSAYEHCVTLWENIHTSPQYSHRELKFLNPWDLAAGGNND